MSVKVHEPVCEDSAQDLYFWFDHFLGDQLKDEWRVVSTGSTVVVDAQTGGIIRLTTGAVTNNAEYVDWGNIRSLHIDKKVTIETRSKLVQTTYVQAHAIELFFDANNRVTFYYIEGAGGAANWQIWTEDDGAATGPSDSGIAGDTEYHIFRIECFPTDEVHFYIDGIETANSPITTNIPSDAGDYLQPRIYIQTKEDATKSIDVDYVVARQER